MKIVSLLPVLLILSSCHVARFVYHGLPGIKDYTYMPSAKIRASMHPFHFIESKSSTIEKISSELDTMHFRGISYKVLLDSSKTVAFIVIRNDSIIYEKYLEGYNRQSMISVFSVSKTFLSALTGIALNEGKIKSLDEPITNYLPELKDPAFHRVKIRQLMNMTAGIDIHIGKIYNVFTGPAKFYYSSRNKIYFKKIYSMGKPDSVFMYSNLNAQLLGYIIERAVGEKLFTYFEEKLWQPMGAEYDATWTYDNKKTKMVKSFSGLNMRAIDLAKLGRLYLHHGNYMETQVVPSSWVDSSTKVIRDKRFSLYSYLWWHHVHKTTEIHKYSPAMDSSPVIYSACTCEKIIAEPDYLAEGLLGQFLYVLPEKNMMVIRIGKQYAFSKKAFSNGRINWREILNKVVRTL